MRLPWVSPAVFWAVDAVNDVHGCESTIVIRLTNVALQEVVGLALSGMVARELPVNFVLDVRHRDERRDDTTPATRLDCPRP